MSGQPGSADDVTAAVAPTPGGGGPAPAAAAVQVAGRARAAGAVGAWLRQERQARGWNVPETARRLRAAATTIGDTLPGRTTLEARIRRWERGVIAPSERYKLLYCHALGITAAHYGPVPLPPPPSPPQMLTAAAGPPRPAGPGCGPAAPFAALAAGPLPPGSWCPGALARMIAEAIVAGVACHCATGHAAPGSHPNTSAAGDHAGSQDTVRRLIAEAAYKRGAEVTAIARVVGVTTDEVRDVLRSADTGTWTS